MDNTFVIIDGNSLMNRAYYAMQRPMVTKQGIYTQGVFGFLNMLNKIKTDYEPGYIAVAFDMKAPTFRHKEYDDYKAGRKKMPDELAMQMPIIKEILSAMNISVIETEGYEADDIIGTLAVRGEKAGLAPLIITGDKDELQLATDVTKVIITRKGISEFDVFDKQAMLDEYGFTPSQFIDFKGLMGDPSDNIPGVPGVGKKTAQKLILEYGDIDNLIRNLDDMKKSKVKENIQDNIELALMSRRLAEINTNVPLDDEYLDMETHRVWEPDYERLVELYRKLEFNSFLKKLSSAAGKTGSAAVLGADDIEKKNIVSSLSDEEKREITEVFKGGKITLKVLNNFDHCRKTEIYGIGILSGERFWYIDSPDENAVEFVISGLNEHLPEITGCTLIDDYYALLSNGAEEFNTGFDASIAQYVLDSGRSNYDISALALEYLMTEIKNEKDFMKENAQTDLFNSEIESFSSYVLDWCRISEALRDVLEARLEEDGTIKLYRDVENPLIEIMAYMGAEGFAVDVESLDATGRSLKEKIDELSEKIYELAGEKFNIKSPKQLGVILFEKLELPAGKKTKTGYSTNAAVLEGLYDRHEIIPLILEYRMLTKLDGTYIEGLKPLVASDGRIHAHFQQTVAATGRISCTEPNLQNIPVRHDVGRQIRKAFVPGEGFVLTGADYSQIELRVLAHMAGDEALTEAFNNGEDIHRHTAANVLGVPEDEITALQRSRAKAINFGVIYGMSGFRLSSELDISRKEADSYISEYFKKYSAVKEFLDSQVNSAKKLGYVETILHRKRYINEITSSNFMTRQAGERLAKNSPIQGSAADIIKIAMIRVYRELKKRKMRSRLVLQIHDELIVETYMDEADEVRELLRECMESAMELSVKLTVDINCGETWYELK